MTFFQTLMHGVKCIKSINLGTTDENGENKNILKTKGAATIDLKNKMKKKALNVR